MDSRGWNGLTVWFEKTTPLLPLPRCVFPTGLPQRQAPRRRVGSFCSQPGTQGSLPSSFFVFVFAQTHDW